MIAPQFRFPAEGTVNALVIFVQHKDNSYRDCKRFDGWTSAGLVVASTAGVSYDVNCAGQSDSWTINEYQSWTEDPSTEWPANLPFETIGTDTDKARQLPAWANTVIDLPGTTTITDGSLTDFYNRMSNGRLNLRGRVWPHTYIPDEARAWYDSNRTPYRNGAVKLSREVIEYVNANSEGLDFTSSEWDLYTNGDGTDLVSDGRFDMVIMVFRGLSLTTIARDDFPPNPTGPQPNNVTSLGSPLFFGDAFTPTSSESPLMLGSYQVIDNTYSGSGILNTAYTRKSAIRIIAHELGHRHFDLRHTDASQTNATREHDYLSVMNASPRISYSAGDRIKLGWANIQHLDASAITGASTSVTLRDAAVVHPTEPDVLWIRNGSTDGCGDLIVEARMHSTYWDSPPGPGNDDDDAADFYLPTEGLYLSKAPLATGCGNSYYSSLHNSLFSIRRGNYGADSRNPAGMYTPGFGVGDRYLPFTRQNIAFHESPAIDERIAITNITKVGNSFSFTVHSNYPQETGITKLLTDAHEIGLSGDIIARHEDWALEGSYVLDGSFVISRNSEVSFESGSSVLMTGALDVSDRTDIFIREFGELTFEANSTLTLEQNALIETEGTLILNSAAIFNGGCAELIARGTGVILDEAGTDITGSCACTMPDGGGVYALGSGRSLRYTNGGFLANQAGTYTLASNAEIDLTSTAEKVHILPGSTFDLASSAEVRIAIDDSRPQSIIGSAAAPVTFDGGTVTVDGADLTLAHVAFTNAALHVENGADVEVVMDPSGSSYTLGAGFKVAQGATFKIGPGTIPAPSPQLRTFPETSPEAAPLTAISGADLSTSSQAATARVSAPTQQATAPSPPREELPLETHVGAAYPNPFGAVTSIPYALAEQAEVVLEVYNVLGRRVAQLVTGVQSAGQHTASWAPSGLPSGVYLVRLQAGTFQQTQRLVLTQ
ncbi:MAG: T9SS type A sorting domain-containing protein [Bacteroidota bacterium]